MQDLRQPSAAFPNVSLRWLLSAIGLVLLGAIVCAWLALCLLYWQGSWQLLYHPAANITRTPASVNLPFKQIRFAATETGTTQLTGWWIPNPNPRFTVLYLHSADGNLSNTVDTLASLHRNQLAIFAFDYRGYGQSHIESTPIRPSEKQLRQDAEWALTWLTVTRSVPPKNIIILGTHLGANLAAELAADHSEVAGVILDQPLQDATAVIFNDPRSKLVPAHWMVKDRYDLTAAATSLHIPSLWLLNQPASNQASPEAYKAVPTQKASAWLRPPVTADPHFDQTLKRWLDDLPPTTH
jgi:pimeloyl-ACP methyl ester carboxylesterase